MALDRAIDKLSVAAQEVFDVLRRNPKIRASQLDRMTALWDRSEKIPTIIVQDADDD